MSKATQKTDGANTIEDEPEKEDNFDDEEAKALEPLFIFSCAKPMIKKLSFVKISPSCHTSLYVASGDGLIFFLNIYFTLLYIKIRGLG